VGLAVVFRWHIAKLDHFQNHLPAFDVSSIKLSLCQVMNLKLTLGAFLSVACNAMLLEKGLDE